MSPELLEHAIEQAAASIIVTDYQGRLLYVNRMFERITGYQREEVLGTNCSVLQVDAQGIRHHHQPGLTLLRAAITKGEACTTQLNNFRKTGEWFINELMISPIRDASGATRYFVGVQNDITQRVRVEETLNQKRVVERTVTLLEQIFGSFNHEMRTPLSRINVSSYLARKYLMTEQVEQVERHLKAVENDVRIARTMLDRFAMYKRLYVELPRFVHRSPAHLIENEVTIFGNRHPHVEVLSQVDAMPASLIDMDCFGLALRELLDNAMIHNHSARLPSVYLNAWSEGQKIVVQVVDNGTGIADEDQPQIFDPFFRGNRARTSDETRVGLGLSIALRIVEVHRGMLWLERSGDSGSVFRLELPVEEQT